MAWGPWPAMPCQGRDRFRELSSMKMMTPACLVIDHHKLKRMLIEMKVPHPFFLLLIIKEYHQN
jgi:hypothetical protein